MNKVSVIIPFLNAEKYIEKCVNSVITQTYENLEILLIDNGSRDNSIEAVKRIKDNRIRLLILEEPGVSKARNYGINEATGEYIFFIDSDDFIERNCIEKLVLTIKKQQCDVVMFNYKRVLEKDNVVIETLPWKNMLFDKKDIYEKMIPKLISTEIWGSVWRMFFCSNVIQKNKIRFKEDIKIAEDLLFNIELLTKINNIFLLEEVLYNYVVSTNSTLNRYKKDNLEQNRIFHYELVNLLKRENIFDENLDEYKKNKIVMYTTSVSNAVRNKRYKEKKEEVRKIINMYNNDELQYNDVNVGILIKITLFLIKKKMSLILIFLYTIKEKVRKFSLKH